MKITLVIVLVVALSSLAFSVQTQPAYALKTITNDATGGDCQSASVGTWNAATNTCTLTSDLSEGIVIGYNGITLDGNGHTISGTTGNGILVQVRTGVTIKNINIKNFDTGINVDNSIGITLSGNTVTGSSTSGITGSYSNTLTITSNKVSGSSHGIYLVHSTQNSISNNIVSNNSDGILVSVTDNTSVSGNTVSNNSGNGIYLIYLGSDTVTGNTVSGNNIGILMSQSSTNTIASNTVTGNGNGITVSDDSYNNILIKNTISSNTNSGISIINSGNAAKITDNTISNNNLGISITPSNSVTVYNNNLINNPIQVTGASSSTLGLNPPIGGNYWSDYSPTCTNTNGDSFCDTPYPFSGGTVGVIDNYPWTIQNGWHTTITTGGDITTTVVGNTTSKLVSYTVSATQDSSPISVICTPSSGSSFQIGKTMVVCTASTGVKASFAITVNQADTIPPVVTPPPSQQITATSNNGAIVIYPQATATDNVGVTSGPTCTPSSGSTFPVGATTVTCTASDAGGNVGRATFTVTVNPMATQTIVTIPPSMKTIAAEWSTGTISDMDFLQSVQYFINQGTMTVPGMTTQSGTSSPIPQWIKNNAKWWSDGSVDDATFASGITYLFNNGNLPVTLNGIPTPVSNLQNLVSPITVSTDRSSYSAGDEIYFSGTISNTDPPNVTLLIFDPTNKFIIMTSGIANSNHQFQIIVDTSAQGNPQKFSLQGTYTATAFTTDKTKGATTSFAFSPSSTTVTPPLTTAITAATDKSSYVTGDSIVVSGTISQVSSVNPQQPVTIQTYDMYNVLVRIDQVIPSSSGQFSATIPTHGPSWQNTGTYTLKIQYDQPSSVSKLTFYFNSGAVPAPTSTSQTQSEIDISVGAGASASAACVTTNNCFSPNPTYVSPGTTVTWKNTDTVSHTVTSGHVSDDNSGSLFDSGLIHPTPSTISSLGASTFSFTFTNAGTYNYFCTVHPWMIGQVIVGSSQPIPNPQSTPSLEELLKQRTDAAKKLQELLNSQNATSTQSSPYASTSVIASTQQNIDAINQAKASQTIAAEVNVGTNQSTTTIDNNVSVQTTSNTPDSLNVNVSASSQTGPKVIAFNLAATTINVQNLKDLGVMYDGKLIQPAPNMDAILHAKPTDNPSFAIVVTQSGVQVLVLVPHFSTHSITITNMSKIIQAVPEFPFAVVVLIIATFSIVLIPKIRHM